MNRTTEVQKRSDRYYIYRPYPMNWDIFDIETKKISRQIFLRQKSNANDAGALF